MSFEAIKKANNSKVTEIFESMAVLEECCLLQQNIETVRYNFELMAEKNIKNLKMDLQLMIQKSYTILSSLGNKNNKEYERIMELIEKRQKGKQHLKKSGNLKEKRRRKRDVETKDLKGSKQSQMNILQKEISQVQIQKINKQGKQLIVKNQEDIQIKTKRAAWQTYICGCGLQSLSLYFFRQHIKNQHSNMYPQGTSHIHFRNNSFNDRRTFWLAKTQKKYKDQNQIVDCPCMFSKPMNKMQFINHVIKVHKGISPIIYQL